LAGDVVDFVLVGALRFTVFGAAVRAGVTAPRDSD
jgi:hypothetical protein